VDFAEYERYSALFKAEMRKISPQMQNRGIDEAFLDVTDVPGSSEEIARRIKSGIFAATGLTCSIGIAPNKLLAKMASELDKPDGLTVLGDGDLRGAEVRHPLRNAAPHRAEAVPRGGLPAGRLRRIRALLGAVQGADAQVLAGDAEPGDR
jgi:hypothetical protein